MGLTVLSLFDGMSCGQLALQRSGINYSTYFASEIDRHAIRLTQHHFPDTVQLGDVTTINPLDLPKIDLLIGGSPCQGFSFAGKQLNFDDHRSALFFEFVRILRECQPSFWLLENVVMKQEFIDIISNYLGVAPIEINSSLVSAQQRKRLYWTNFSVSQPPDSNILLSDILEPSETKMNKGVIVGRRINERGVRDDYNKNIPLVQCLEVRTTNTDKSNCLTTVDKDNVLSPLPPGRYTDPFGNKLPFRYYTLKEYCRLQTVPDTYFDGVVSETQARKMLGNGWTVDVLAHIFSCLPIAKDIPIRV